MTAETWLPAEVRRIVTEITDHTGTAPDVHRVETRRFRLTLANARVRMTLDVKMTGPGRWKWAGSTLHVDGVRVPIMPSPEAFYRLFNDPDEGGRRPAELPPLEPYPLEDAPVEEALLFQAVRGRFDANPRFAEAILTFGRDPEGGGVLQIADPSGVTVQLTVLPEGIGMRAVKDGFEATHDLDADLREAVGALVRERGVPKPVQPGSPGARGQREAARLTSVEVRRQSVIRV